MRRERRKITVMFLFKGRGRVVDYFSQQNIVWKLWKPTFNECLWTDTLNSLDHDEWREIHLCSYYWRFRSFFYLSDAWQMFKSWHQADLFQKIRETWGNLSKTSINILRTSVWWTENPVNLSGVSVPNLEIAVNYAVKWAFLFLPQVQVATHCWKRSCFQSLH